MIRPIGAEGLDRRGPVGSCQLFLGPGFRLAACWDRLVETVKTRKQRGKTGKKRARYGLKRVQRQQRRLGRSGDSQAVDDAEGLERPEGLDDQPPEQPHRRRPDILSKFKLI